MTRKRWPALFLLLLLHARETQALDLPHYDQDSLVYLSTDIVIAKISAGTQNTLSAKVTESLLGLLRPGDRVERLAPFLMPYRPMEEGMNVILFLDRRQHSYNSISADAANSPFAVPPSGVYLIDVSGRIHKYFQQNNPGPYIAEGYSFFIHETVPPHEQDSKLPTLAETRNSIATSLRQVKKMRPLLDRVASRQDLPKLFALLKSRKQSGVGCGSRAGDAIVERVSSQVRAFKDPQLLLKLRTMTADFESDVGFVQEGADGNTELASSRVPYLLQMLSDKKADGTMRIAAAETLKGLSRFRTATQNGPAKTWTIDNDWLNGSTVQIRAVARTIFDDDTESLKLRGLCLAFLPLDNAEVLDNVRRVYARSRSKQLRYTIEDLFLQVSDSLYKSLHPPGGPVASIVIAAEQASCVIATAGKTAFVMKYHQQRDFDDSTNFPAYSLTNTETGQRIVPLEIHQLKRWNGGDHGEEWFDLATTSNLAPGNYFLRYEFSLNGSIVSAGYPMLISVKDTRRGKVVLAQSPSP